jgi:hypothetical protein
MVTALTVALAGAVVLAEAAAAGMITAAAVAAATALAVRIAFLMMGTSFPKNFYVHSIASLYDL